MALGASRQDIASVAANALDFTDWRLHTFEGRDDGAWAASTWTLLRRDSINPIGVHAPGAQARTPAERDAVRWALARYAYLLEDDIDRHDALVEAVTIPLEASASRNLTPEQWTRLKKNSDVRPERNNMVPGTVPVWAENAMEYKVQRVFARRLLTIDRAGCWHDGWLTVPTMIASQFGWTPAT